MSTKKLELGTLKDVAFFYTSTTRPVKQLNKENKPHLSEHPLEMHSYEIKIAIEESRYKKLKKAYPKAKNFINASDISVDDFMLKYAPEGFPKPEEDMVLIKFAQTCMVGKPNFRKESKPITQIGIRGRVQDYDGNTIDQETNIGNGTMGHLQIRPVQSDYGLYLYPNGLCITNLVEYTPNGGVDESAFGIEELEEVDIDKPKDAGEDSFDDDIPF